MDILQTLSRKIDCSQKMFGVILSCVCVCVHEKYECASLQIIRSLELVGIIRVHASHQVDVLTFHLQKLLIPCIQNYVPKRDGILCCGGNFFVD